MLERFVVREAPVSVDDLREADELFLTNAIRGIRWVRRFGDRDYGHDFSAALNF